VVTRRSTSGGHGVSVPESMTRTITAVVGRTHFKAKTVSLALLMSSTSLLSGSKNFFNPKVSSYLYLKLFQMKLKAEHFQVYDLVTAQNTGNQDSILGRLIC
jgi:hypothetical protein